MRRPVIPLILFISVILVANLLTLHFGLVSPLGLTATAGTWVAGLAFLLRDALQEAGGRRWVLAAIAVGAAASALLSPGLAIASAVAFILAELLDWGIYSRLRARGLLLAVVASNLAGALLDSYVFLVLAGFPTDGTVTQVVIKMGMTLLVTPLVLRDISRQPL